MEHTEQLTVACQSACEGRGAHPSSLIGFLAAAGWLQSTFCHPHRPYESQAISHVLSQAQVMSI